MVIVEETVSLDKDVFRYGQYTQFWLSQRGTIGINGTLKLSIKVQIFWEGYKILQNLHLTFVLCSASQKQGEDFAKFCGLLRIYELYKIGGTPKPL